MYFQVTKIMHLLYNPSSVIWLLRLLHLVGCQPRSINICCFESTLLTRLHCTHFCISRFLYFVFQWICMFVFSNVSSRPSQPDYTALTFVFLCFCILYFSEFVCLYFQMFRGDPPSPPTLHSQPYFLYFSVFVFLYLSICNSYFCIFLFVFCISVHVHLYSQLFWGGRPNWALLHFA